MWNSRNSEILNINIDIGGGKTDQIKVFELDQPSLLARDFANKHNLTQKLELALSRNISELIQEANREHAMLNNTMSSRPEITTSTSCKNIGEKLYTKGLQHKEQVEINTQLLKMHLDKKLESTASFKPVINKNSLRLAKNPNTRSTIHSRQSTKTEEVYSFAPKLNEKSKKLAGNSTNRVQDLYEEAKLRESRLEQMNQHARKTEFPFKPEVTHGKPHSSAEEIVERLVNSRNGYEKTIEDLKKKYEITRDPETGQEFFKPNICKSMDALKLQLSPRSQESVWDSLYKHQKKVVEAEENFPYSPVKLDSKSRSEKLLLKVKIDRFSEVFQQLNPDVNGLISYKNIQVHEVDTKVLKIIAPLLSELEELNQPLNFEEFVDSMENLLKTLNTAEKDVFLTKQRKKIEDSESSIKKSVSSGDYANVYKRHLEQQNMTSAKLEIEREKKKRKELDGCTFKPSTTKYPN